VDPTQEFPENGVGISITSGGWYTIVFRSAPAADKLLSSPKTVESHRKLIKMKLNLRTAAQLSRSAFQWVQECH
jgi:hypothetical protein